MTLGFAFKIFFEIGMVLLIAYGILNEDKLIAFENELVPLLKFMFKKYILKKNVGTKKTANTQRTEVARREAPKHRAEIKKLPVKRETRSFKRVA